MRQVALSKRVSLAEFSEGWDDCYVLVRPATYVEAREFAAADIKDLTNDQQLQMEMEIVRSHFISGRIKVIEDGKEYLANAEPGDLEASIPMANKVFFEILGVTLDPKGSAKTA